MRFWKLAFADLLLAVAAVFGILLVTAPDHPTAMQGVVAWVLAVVLAILGVGLLGLVVVGIAYCYDYQ